MTGGLNDCLHNKLGYPAKLLLRHGHAPEEAGYESPTVTVICIDSFRNNDS